MVMVHDGSIRWNVMFCTVGLVRLVDARTDHPKTLLSMSAQEDQ